MKCLNCIHYDVVNMECQNKELADMMQVDGPITTDFDFGCNKFQDATAKNILDSIHIKVSVEI